MPKYIMRLDDACHRMDIEKWIRMESILDKYSIRPLVGVIPKIEDDEMSCYEYNNDFWNLAKKWISKGWSIALHGYDHVCDSKDGGINPVNDRSEFAGVPLEEQQKKIREGMAIFVSNEIVPVAFFAPAHTFDANTIKALKKETDIRIISDTIASRPYCKDEITYVPQQSGTVRRLFLNTVTFCYHPNKMDEKDFCDLEKFLQRYSNKFIEFPTQKSNNKESIYDLLLRKMYFLRQKKRKIH